MTSDDGKPFHAAPLAELCDETRGITYGIVKVGEFVQNGIPVVRGGDVRNNRIGIDDGKRVSDEVSRRFKRTVLRGGEIVLNLIAEPGHSAIVPASLAGANVTRDVAVIPVTAADTGFVNYYLQSPQCIGWLRAHLQGSVTLKINLGTLASLPVPKPPIAEQRRISSVLRALDDKIDSNRRLAGLLEETAATLFRAWFVDYVGFEEFQESALGPIPRGWQAGSLVDLAKFVNGKAFTKHASGAGRPILRIRELNQGVDGQTLRAELDADDRYIAYADDILFAWSGSLGVYRWPGDDSLINQHIFKVIPDGTPKWFVHQWIEEHMGSFRSVAADKATTMGHIQRRHLAEARVAVPSSHALEKAERVVGPIDQHRAALVQENRTLTELREALLPKLISGEIRVPVTSDPAEVIEPMVA